MGMTSSPFPSALNYSLVCYRSKTFKPLADENCDFLSAKLTGCILLCFIHILIFLSSTLEEYAILSYLVVYGY